ncbi:hypothetical protein OPV22_002999 [Ensete ventricosum]|uniref:Glycosyl transferase CAP10 domain-containing protein n=1 Tax=Ensete ventricosum TaxID=4639 RepID=A0AAV8RZC2_ENSVE|nr:hypothetical protein OPV22_002999 [Ensete ventricosum]
MSIATTSKDDERLWSWRFRPREDDDKSMAYQPPAELMHNMTDGELFQRAVDVSQLSRQRLGMAPKIAFMFLTKGALPLSPLWEKYFAGHSGLYSIYVHPRPSYHADNASSSVFYRRQIPSKVVSWGSLSLVDAERRLLANALVDLSNERFVLLSESCIPLFNFSFTYQYLMSSRYSFVDAFDEPGPAARGRYEPKLAPEINVTEWRKGAQWFEASRQVAVIVVNETRYYAKFDELRDLMYLEDEHYIPTMLTIKAAHLIANRTLTWAYWTGGSHPRTFGQDDVSDGFLRKINQERNCSYNDQPPSTVCYLFARKFAPSALEPLLKLAPTSLGFG